MSFLMTLLVSRDLLSGSKPVNLERQARLDHFPNGNPGPSQDVKHFNGRLPKSTISFSLWRELRTSDCGNHMTSSLLLHILSQFSLRFVSFFVLDRPEPHVLLFRRPLDYGTSTQSRQATVDESRGRRVQSRQSQAQELQEHTDTSFTGES
jgi:hypothetical protein